MAVTMSSYNTSPLSTDIILLDTTRSGLFPWKRASSRSLQLGTSIRKKSMLSAPSSSPTRMAPSSATTRPETCNRCSSVNGSMLRRSTILIHDRCVLSWKAACSSRLYPYATSWSHVRGYHTAKRRTCCGTGKPLIAESTGACSTATCGIGRHAGCIQRLNSTAVAARNANRFLRGLAAIVPWYTWRQRKTATLQIEGKRRLARCGHCDPRHGIWVVEAANTAETTTQERPLCILRRSVRASQIWWRAGVPTVVNRCTAL